MTDLETRVRQFERLELPGQLPAMHMGTAYLVSDLWKEIERLREQLHYASGACELAMLQRDTAEAKLHTMEIP